MGGDGRPGWLEKEMLPLVAADGWAGSTLPAHTADPFTHLLHSPAAGAEHDLTRLGDQNHLEGSRIQLPEKEVQGMSMHLASAYAGAAVPMEEQSAEEGKPKKPVRKRLPSAAQREAHKRHRQRKRAQVGVVCRMELHAAYVRPAA